MALKKEINWDLVELYCRAGCTQQKIADSLCITRETLGYRTQEQYGKDWSTFSTALRCEGDMIIEGQQFQKAAKGYWPALQWLGKVRLGQREPEMLNQLANNQPQIDQTHKIMELEHELERLKASTNKDEPKAEQEFL